MRDYYIAIPHDDYVIHHGVLGQKWGVRRYQNDDGSYTDAGRRRYTHAEKKTIRQASKDAKEYARAKMYYGDGAGNRRKLINATVKQRSKDPLYKKAFDSELAGKDWAKEASKAKSERHRKDVKNNTEKTARGVVNTVRGNGMYAGAAAFVIGTGVTAYIRNKPKVDATIKGAFNRVVNKVNYAKAMNQAQDFFRRNGL